MLFHHQDTVRSLPGGAGQSGVTVTFKKVADNSTITTAVTDSNGFFQKSLADTATTGQSSYTLHPGPYYTQFTVGNYTRRHSSVSIGKAGPLDLSGVVQLSRALGNGLISSPANGLNTGANTANGSARAVVVATFAAVLDGITVWNDAARTLTIAANAAGSTRIDTIVIEMTKAGQAEEGKCLLKVVQGTAGAGAPTLTDSSSLVQFPLANVSVANGASVINQANITDRRDYVERSVTAVETQVNDHETRLDALEGYRAPREEIVATRVATFDPPSLPANSHTVLLSLANTDFSLHNGYTGFDDTMFAEGTHTGLTPSPALYLRCKVVRDSVFPSIIIVQVAIRNYGTAAYNPASGTLTVVVKKLVTS